MVNVVSRWWQWYLNRSHLSFLCLCRNILLIRICGDHMKHNGDASLDNCNTFLSSVKQNIHIDTKGLQYRFDCLTLVGLRDD